MLLTHHLHECYVINAFADDVEHDDNWPGVQGETPEPESLQHSWQFSIKFLKSFCLWKFHKIFHESILKSFIISSTFIASLSSAFSACRVFFTWAKRGKRRNILSRAYGKISDYWKDLGYIIGMKNIHKKTLSVDWKRDIFLEKCNNDEFRFYFISRLFTQSSWR